MTETSEQPETLPESSDVITVFETGPGGISVLWDRNTGRVRVHPDGNWIFPQKELG